MAQNPTMLVVNDNREMLRLFSRVFRIEGYRVVTASDSTTAMKIVNEKGTLSLAIIQLEETRRQSIELCRHICDKLPVIILAAKYDDYDEVHAFEAGAEDFIAKPVSVVQLVARTKVALRRAGYQVKFDTLSEPSSGDISNGSSHSS